MCSRLTTIDGCNRHLLTMTRITTNGSINTPMIQGHISLDQGNIALLNLMPLHLVYEHRLNIYVLRDNEETRCIPVQAMDNTRSQISLALLKFGITGD